MDAAEMFLIHHQRMHAHVDWLSQGLSEEQIRGCAHPLVNPLAWLLWLPALMAYWQTVGEQTAERVAPLRPLDLDQVVSSERISRFVTLTVQGSAKARLEQLWQGATTGHFLVWLVLAHNSEHIGQADLIRGILGQPGRF
jgi:hypothetical protein